MNRTTGRIRQACLGFAVVFLLATVASAASYIRTTLKELTSRAAAVAEVKVVDKTFPAMQPSETFPRTHVQVQVLKTFKGSLPETFELDIPGGINGNVASYVPDGPEFKTGERAIVFVKQPEKDHFAVQDLGLGKFNIVQRGNGTFVENPLCPRAWNAAKPQTQEDLDANLFSRSIPYDTFCRMIGAYALGQSAPDAAELAAKLPPSIHTATTPAVVLDAMALKQSAEARSAWYYSVAAVVLVLAMAALIVWKRRRQKAGPGSARAISLLLIGALLAGAKLGATTSHAFVQFDQKTTWDLDKTVAGKVENQRIIWKQSSSVSKTNPNVFTGVQQSFDRWEAVNASRLAFTAGGPTSAIINNSKDAENIIAWSTTLSSDFSDRTLAITFSSFSTGSNSFFLDADMIFNDRDFDWSASGTGNPASVSLHEIGHFVGLNHTADDKTVMFPFDGGLLNLSIDEIAAAQALYPGAADTSVPPPVLAGNPTAIAEASPTAGDPGLVVSFNATNTKLAPGGAALVSFDWNFGDGTTGSGMITSHTYAIIGSFMPSLKVTDAAGGTSTITLSVPISIGTSFSSQKGSFKLNFKSVNKDSFTAVVFSDKFIGIKTPKGAGQVFTGSLDIGDQDFVFFFDTSLAKTINKGGAGISVNTSTGQATITLKNADMQTVLSGHGAANATVTAQEVDVPLTLWFGPGSGIYLFGEVKFSYNAVENKNGLGKKQ